MMHKRGYGCQTALYFSSTLANNDNLKQKVMATTMYLTDRLGGKEAWRPTHFS